MKHFILTLAFLASIISFAQAQDQIIKTSPFGLAFGNLNVIYERVLNEKSSAIGRARYFYNSFGVDVSSFGLMGGWRYYLTNEKKDIPNGLYVQPQISADFGSSGDFNYSAIGIGAQIGYQWVWSSGVALDLGIGPIYTIFGGEFDDIGFDRSGGSGVLPALTIALGYAW